jgi:hypothetical protein
MSSLEDPQAQEDQKVRKDLQAIARTVDRQIPYGWGFVVLAFPFGAGGRMNYVANANRADVVRAMYEFIEATKAGWAKDEPPIGSAAEDEQLGRARQRIAELEGEREKLVNFCKKVGGDLATELAVMHAVLQELCAGLRKNPLSSLSPSQEVILAVAEEELKKSQAKFFAEFGDEIGGKNPENN